MIPAYPEFKKIELPDKAEIDHILQDFPKCSDYNFTSLWIWNIDESLAISVLNGNLVIRFRDYVTCQPFYSFCGGKELTKTATELLNRSLSEGFPTTLKLLLEPCIEQIDAPFIITEDRGNFDYIYDINTFLFMEDPQFHTKRKHWRYFLKTFKHEVRELDISFEINQLLILDLWREWAKNKLKKDETAYFHNEYLALCRYLEIAHDTDCLALGIFSEGKLIGISISENIGNGYSICHFQKAITKNFKGLNVFLIHEVAKILAERGIRYINWEQDLDIPGLRESKESYLPSLFIKKYSLSTK